MATTAPARETSTPAPDAGGWHARFAGAASAPARPAFTPRFLLGVVLCVVVVMGLRATPLMAQKTDVFDLYPVYFGGRAWLQTGNAYATQQVVPAYHQPWDLYRTGNMYPLPAVL